MKKQKLPAREPVQLHIDPTPAETTPEYTLEDIMNEFGGWTKREPGPAAVPEAPEPPKTEDNIDRTPSSDENHDFTPESSEAPPTYTPEDTEKKPTPPPVEKPQGGGGLPGFDNVPDGGANQVTNADDMYENGNKIGSMD